MAENGSLALDIIASKQFDLIFMDMHMPVMDGFTASKQIRDKHISTPTSTCEYQIKQGFNADHQSLEASLTDCVDGMSGRVTWDRQAVRGKDEMKHSSNEDDTNQRLDNILAKFQTHKNEHETKYVHFQ